jgi:hypothetical protein
MRRLPLLLRYSSSQAGGEQNVVASRDSRRDLSLYGVTPASTFLALVEDDSAVRVKHVPGRSGAYI